MQTGCKCNRIGRYFLLGLVILLAAYWGGIHAQEADVAKESGYPEAALLSTPASLAKSQDQVVIVDVRADKYFDNRVIPGAIRMPWKLFRTTDKEKGLASTFIGIAGAEKVLGGHGITPSSKIVLYDSVERDGGATASYVFWVLDLLGHKNKSVLEGGIDAWVKAGHPVEKTPATLKPVEYTAGLDTIDRATLASGTFIQQRLDDPHYQILDVRTPEEYLGEKGTKGAWDNPLKLGHIPGAYNIPYTDAWLSEKTKMLKPFAELSQLYSGLDPNRTIIVYCASGRRGSYTYYVLRLLGYPRVMLYEGSWKDWGEPRNHFPVETTPHDLPQGSASLRRSRSMPEPAETRGGASRSAPSGSSKPSGGYVSCGG